MNGYMLGEDREIIEILPNVRTVSIGDGNIEYDNGRQLVGIDFDTMEIVVATVDEKLEVGDILPADVTDMKESFELKTDKDKNIKLQKDIADLTLQLVMGGII